MTEKSHILYIDDEKENLESFRQIFDTLYHVILASNQTEAYEQLKKYPIKVVLCDQRMPNITGLEICKEINQVYPNIICLIVTAHANFKVTLQALNQPEIGGFIMKPWETDEVKIRINNNIQKFDLVCKNQELISELQKKNNELDVAWKKAMESDELKTAFISNLSHEIKSPLNGIIGFTDILQQNTQNLTGKQVGFLDLIANAGKQLQGIISNILDYSKVEAGTIIVHTESINLNVLLHEIYLLQKQLAEKRNLQLILDSNNIPSTNIEMDKAKLTQILNNLISNAIKFTPNGKIELSCQVDPNDANMLLFRVSDTGVGIPEDDYVNVFKRFRQIHTKNHQFSKGNGLGLSIVKSYIELLDGEIWLKSKVNEGTEFFFNLPLNFSQQNIPKANEAQKKGSNYSKMNVLIADDEFANFAYLKEILSEKCKKVHHAKNGLEAIETCLDNNIDLILMDVKMPIMDGYKAAQEIKKIRKKIAIIAQTAYGITTDYEKLQVYGFDEVLTKPFTISELMHAINKVFKKREAL